MTCKGRKKCLVIGCKGLTWGKYCKEHSQCKRKKHIETPKEIKGEIVVFTTADELVIDDKYINGNCFLIGD